MVALAVFHIDSLFTAGIVNQAAIITSKKLESGRDMDYWLAALSVDAQNNRANYYVGLREYLDGHYEDSIYFLARAFQDSNARDVLAGLYLGLAYDALGEHAKALGVWVASHSSEYFATRAKLRQMAGDLQLALADYELALRIDPAAVEARIDLASNLRDLGQPAKAIEVLLEAYRLAPSSKDVDQALVTTYADMRDFISAAEWDERTAEVVDDSEALLYLGRAELWRGKYSESIHDLSGYIENTPNDAAAAYAYGLLCSAYRNIGESQLAIQACMERIELGAPPEAAWYGDLGDIYAEAQDVEAAQEAYQTALQLDSQNQQAIVGLQRLGR